MARGFLLFDQGWLILRDGSGTNVSTLVAESILILTIEDEVIQFLSISKVGEHNPSGYFY
jgi:hypothetical protein